jgi:hypothetical protein
MNTFNLKTLKSVYKKLQYLVKNLPKIIKGFWRTLFKDGRTELIAKERLEICRSNKCGYYDPQGKSEAAYIKGVESCGACGCVLETKVRCLDCVCGLEEVGSVPLWREQE